ncbi:hypothetical protein, partial [Comamonas sp. B-9]
MQSEAASIQVLTTVDVVVLT